MPDLVTTGFATKVAIDGNQVSCTSLNISENSSFLESSGGYGGNINGSDIGVSGPLILDVGETSLSMGIEPSRAQLFYLINWLKSRDSSKSVTINTGTVGIIHYGECFLNSMTIACAENSLVTMDFNMMVQKAPFFDGTLGGIAGKTSVGVPIVDQVPYWNTAIQGLPNNDLLSWSLTFSQNMVKKYECGGGSSNNNPPLPKYVFLGPLTIDLTVDIMISKDMVNMQDLLVKNGSGIKVFAGAIQLVGIGKFYTNTTAPVVAEKGGRQTVSVNYRSFQIT